MKQGILLLLSYYISSLHAYLKHDGSSLANESYFQPFEGGFVGYYGSPATYQRERINEGSFENPAKELIYASVPTIQVCPGMVGPFSDGNYYCTAREYGYCDRRSGVCFCNMGYQGIDCTECTPNYFKFGTLCYPKKPCPDDCSGAGTCDYMSGNCTCYPHREGLNCGIRKCTSFDALCQSCTEKACLFCTSGYYVTKESKCRSCYDFDPRCAGCTQDEGCTLCADPILTSIRRSGYRASDNLLPIEEDSREFSITIPFGSKSPESFAEAEAFVVATTPSKPLKDNSMQCDQGLTNDASWTCTPYPASHIVCGHKGVFSFAYPNYVVSEDSGMFRVYVRRSGGGFGHVIINYFITHFNTDDSDMSPTAPYTTSQTLEFNEGIVQRSFLINILEDNKVESDEVFQIVLEAPKGGGFLGAQFRTNVTIKDNDQHVLSAAVTYPIYKSVTVKAGNVFRVKIQSVAADNTYLTVGGELFYSVVENNALLWQNSLGNSSSSIEQRNAKLVKCNVSDLGNGQYEISGMLTSQGTYQLRAWHAFPGGLKGTYYRDAFFQDVSLERIDRYVNFTWGNGRIIPRGSDYISVRWEGLLKPSVSGWYQLKIEADDHSRLWIDGVMLIDHWHMTKSSLEPSRELFFLGDQLYEIILDYRELREDAFAVLKWKTPGGDEFVPIPPEVAYSKHIIADQPISVKVLSTSTTSYTTECHGMGLNKATSLHSASFECCPRDKYKNFRNDDDIIFLASEYFQMTLSIVDEQGYLGEGSEILWPHVKYNTTTSCFQASYTPERAGKYVLNVTYASGVDMAVEHVVGSPFTITVDEDTMSGPNSIVYGLEFPQLMTAGHCHSITIVSRDNSFNYKKRGGERIQAYIYWTDLFFNQNEEVVSTEKSHTPNVRYGDVTDYGNGTYGITICPTIAGWYEFHLLLNGLGVSNIPRRMDEFTYRGQYIDNSPYRLYVFHGDAIGSTSYVAIRENLDGCTAGKPASFVITLRDNWENVVRDGVSTMTASILQTPDVDFTLVSLNNGSYRLNFVPLQSGDNVIHVYVNGGHIIGSPFTVKVADGDVDSTYTYAFGDGLHVGTAGVASTFYLRAFDSFSNQKSDTSASFTFQTSGSEVITGTMLPCSTNPTLCLSVEKDLVGLFYVQFQPLIAGMLTITVNLVDENGQNHEISNSPFTAVIYPGAPYAEESIITGTLHAGIVGESYMVKIHLRDIYQNKLISGGNQMELELIKVASNWGTEYPFQDIHRRSNDYYYHGFFINSTRTFGTWQDLQDGSYVSEFSLESTGDYILRLATTQPGLNATFFNDTHFGNLVTFDDNTQRFIDSMNGDDVNKMTTVSWTGDLGGPSDNDGLLGQGSYLHKYKSIALDSIDFDFRLQDESKIPSNIFHAHPKFREAYWSVRYVGLIYPPFAEVYQFTIQKNQDSQVILKIQASEHEKEVIVVNATQKIEVATGKYSFSSKDPQVFVLEYAHFDGSIPYLSVLWESPTQSRGTIQSEVFKHWRNISHFNFTASPTKLCSHCSTAIGPGISDRLIAGVPTFFYVYGRDIFSNLLEIGGDPVHVVGVGANGAEFRGVVTDLGNSTYHVEFVPLQTGLYRIYVSIGCCVYHKSGGLSQELHSMSPLLVHGSPYAIQVTPNTISASDSIASGENLLSCIVGTWCTARIFLRDAFGNVVGVSSLNDNIDSLGLNVDFIHDGKVSTQFFDIQHSIDHINNAIVINWNSSHAATYTLHINLFDTQAIKGSPFNINMLATTASPDMTIVKGLSRGKVNNHKVVEFDIILYDRFNNRVDRGGYSFYTRFSGSTYGLPWLIPHCVYYPERLVYTCSMTPQYSGYYELQVDLLIPREKSGGSGLNLAFFTSIGEGDQAHIHACTLHQLDATIDYTWQRHQVYVLESLNKSKCSSEFVDISDGVKFIWSGYIYIPKTDGYTLELSCQGFNCSLYLDQDLVSHTIQTSSTHILSDREQFLPLTVGTIYRLRAEAESTSFTSEDVSKIRLLWSTRSMPQSLTVIPQYYLYPEALPIHNSPLKITVVD